MISLESLLRSRDRVTNQQLPYQATLPHDISEALEEQISIWLDDNCKGRFRVMKMGDQYRFKFAEAEEFMLFSMRWT